MRWVMLAAALAFATGARADEWTRADSYMQGVVAVSQVADCSLSLDMPRRYPDVWETNPLLGRHPSRSSIRTWCVGSILGHAAVSAVLPRSVRRYWQVFALGIESVTVMNHVGLGLRLHW